MIGQKMQARTRIVAALAAGLIATPGYETGADAQLNIGQTRQEITVTE